MADDDKTKPSEDKLDKLGEDIEKARRDSDEAIHGSFYEGEPAFVESGEESREDPSDTGEDSKSDDQTIAP
jgi:hypothetical protein